MPSSKSRKSISLKKDLVDRFEYLYPKLTAVFCNRALQLGLQDKELFEKIFFNPVFMEVK